MPVSAAVDWLPGLAARLQREGAVARVVVAGGRGSIPREAGACMLVGASGVEGTIGGGRLEWEATAAARQLLAAGRPAARFMTQVLGVDLGQCCGGVVDLWLECFTAEDLPLLAAAMEAAERAPVLLRSRTNGQNLERRLETAAAGAGGDRVQVERGSGGELIVSERLDCGLPPVWLFGAGHVGRALAGMLVALPLRLTWIDSRPGQLPAACTGARLLQTQQPPALICEAPPGTYFVIMTHSHALDYELCRAVLLRGDQAWAGLIGSASKAARFRARLRRDGLQPEVIARLTCPIGVDGIRSKWPAAIAVAVAAQLLQRFAAAARPALPRVAAVPEQAQNPAPDAASVPLPATTSAAAGCEAGRCDGCGPGGARARATAVLS